MKNSLRKSKINAMLTAIIIFISVVAVGIVYVPRIAGYKAYSIETGSMEPTIHTGSLIFVKKYFNFEDYNAGDVVTFSDLTHEKNFTHRIVDINTQDKTFVTKGDANNVNDLTPTSYIYAVGKVEISIPYIGYIAEFLRNKFVKIAVMLIYVAWAAIEIEIFLAERKKRAE